MNATPPLVPTGAVMPAVAASAWRRALPIWLAVVASVAFLYRDTARAMWDIWTRNDTYAHGFVVLPIALWLAWGMRHHLAALTPRPTPWVLPLAAGVAATWLLADVAAVNSAAQLAFVSLLVLSVPAVLGLAVARALMFPLGFLFFAVPLGDFLLGPMMRWTADVTVFALRLTGVPAYLEGLQLVVPTGTWSVIEACSGLRYLIASVMVGTLFAYLNYASLKRRLLFVGVAILVPILANWVRAYLVVLIGHLSNNTVNVGFDHVIFGWLFFGVVIAVMFMVGMRWAEPDEAGRPLAAAPPPPAQRARGQRFWPSAMAIGALALAPHAVLALLDASERGHPVELAMPATLEDGWGASGGEPLPRWQPAFENASTQASYAFGRGEARVGLYVFYYRQQRYESKLVSSYNVLVRSLDDTWALVSQGGASAETRLGPVAFCTAELRGSKYPATSTAPRLRVWQVYWINGRWVASDAKAKLYTAADRLRGRGDDAAAVILYTPRQQSGNPDEVLQQFVRTNLERIDGALQAARDGSSVSLAEPVPVLVDGSKAKQRGFP